MTCGKLPECTSYYIKHCALLREQVYTCLFSKAGNPLFEAPPIPYQHQSELGIRRLVR